MNRSQRKARHKRRVNHVNNQNARRKAAVAEAHEAAHHLSHNGRTRLKKPRTDVNLIEKIFKDTMERQGYVPNGRGGWRRLHKTPVPKRDPLDKEG